MSDDSSASFREPRACFVKKENSHFALGNEGPPRAPPSEDAPPLLLGWGRLPPRAEIVIQIVDLVRLAATRVHVLAQSGLLLLTTDAARHAPATSRRHFVVLLRPGCGQGRVQRRDFLRASRSHGAAKRWSEATLFALAAPLSLSLFVGDRALGAPPRRRRLRGSAHLPWDRSL